MQVFIETDLWVEWKEIEHGQNHQMSAKCLSNVRCYRQKDCNKLYIFFCIIDLTVAIPILKPRKQLTFHGLFTQENIPVEIVQIGKTVAKVKLLYLARITAVHPIIFSIRVYEQQLEWQERNYHVLSNLESSKLYLNWFSLVLGQLGFFYSQHCLIIYKDGSR